MVVAVMVAMAVVVVVVFFRVPHASVIRAGAYL
jgi:hypothetical protein